jgi:transposase
LSRRKRRTFTEEQKADAVNLIRTSGEPVSRIAYNLGIHANTLHRWASQADIDEGKGPEGSYTTAEKAEIRELRRKIKRLEMERDFLKKAAAFFARENEN